MKNSKWRILKKNNKFSMNDGNAQNGVFEEMGFEVLHENLTRDEAIEKIKQYNNNPSKKSRSKRTRY